MDPYDQIVEMLDDCTITQKALFTCACAERVQPVVVTIASPTTTEFSRSALDEAWRSAGTPVVLSDVHDELASLPEAQIDDSNDPGYYAMRALGLVADALRNSGSAPEDVAASAGGGALDLASDLAMVADEPSLPGLEATAQINTLAALRANQALPSSEELQRIGRDATDAFSRAAKSIVTRAEANRRR
jgi:hypothetical protein